jgi:Heterokaryon incompatibility protein (HET)
MRLLERKNNDEFSLANFGSDNIPQYAILSHTWQLDGEEVTFQDLSDGTDRNKAGYAKIQFCGGKAADDGLQYFWVDTCCIDKSSSAELQEAINSMFRWYHEAAKCYVYLSDVSTHDFDEKDRLSQFTWESAFRKSKWFTRGWTLQELIAPASVEFFSLQGKRLGDKRSLEQQVHEITGIAVQALRGNPLSHFSIAERMSWAKIRETKRKEDLAYSLLGIFDVHMPLIYGEGLENAFIRLEREIDRASKSKLFALSPVLVTRLGLPYFLLRKR